MNPELIKMNLQMFAANSQTNTTSVVGKDVYDPEVLSAMVDASFDHQMLFGVLAETDNTLVGQPGSTITIPSWNMMDGIEGYIEEFQEIPVDKITHSTRKVTIKEIGKGFAVTDKAKAVGIGDPLGEGTRQLGMHFGDRLDTDILDALLTTTNTANMTLDYEGVSTAGDFFTKEVDHHLILFMNPKDARKVRKSMASTTLANTEVGANALISGTFMEVDGIEIVRASKITEGQAVMVKVGTYNSESHQNNDPVVKIINKVPVTIEPERKASQRLTNYYGSAMYGVALYNESRALKLTVTEASKP